jgi:predicted transcriptional regulator
MDTSTIVLQPRSRITLDETELSVIKLLSVKPRSSVEIKELIGKSREHAARLMKILFDSGLVSRNTSKKPFVYQLTETGRRYLSAS